MAVFIDSNVFLYAAGKSEVFRQPCIDFLQSVADGRVDAYTSTEVIQEILHVVQRRHGHGQAVLLVKNVLSLFPLILPIERREIEVACDLMLRYPSLAARDAIHIAVMQNRGLDTIISEDQDFDAVSFIRRISPVNTAAIFGITR